MKKSNNTLHQSTKMTPIYASRKVNEKILFSNFQDKKRKILSIISIRIFRTANVKKDSQKDIHQIARTDYMK